MNYSLDGVNIHTLSSSDCNKLKQLGIKWARIDINWKDIEPSKGNYRWNWIDNSVNGCLSNGIQVYASIAYSPSWLSKDHTKMPNKDEWTRFIKAVVTRYKTKISVYGLWNEPNLKGFGNFKPKEYCENILVPGYKIIKSLGNYQVAGGELSTASSSHWWSWMRMLYKYRKYFDIFSMHSYQPTYDRVIKCFNRGKWGFLGWLIPKWRPYKWLTNKMCKPCWLTEVGWKAKYGSKEENNQYKNISGLMKNKKKTKFKQIFIYEVKDFNNEYWGLFDSRWNKKKVIQ